MNQSELKMTNKNMALSYKNANFQKRNNTNTLKPKNGSIKI